MLFKVIAKGCKKCRGDLYVEEDEDGYYFTCIQCASVDQEMSRLLRKYVRPAAAGAGQKLRLRQEPATSAREPGGRA